MKKTDIDIEKLNAFMLISRPLQGEACCIGGKVSNAQPQAGIPAPVVANQ